MQKAMKKNIEHRMNREKEKWKIRRMQNEKEMNNRKGLN